MVDTDVKVAAVVDPTGLPAARAGIDSGRG